MRTLVCEDEPRESGSRESADEAEGEVGAGEAGVSPPARPPSAVSWPENWDLRAGMDGREIGRGTKDEKLGGLMWGGREGGS